MFLSLLLTLPPGMENERRKVNIQIFTIRNMHACTDRIDCYSAKIQRGGFEDMLFWKNSWEFVMLPLLARNSIGFLQNCVAPLPLKFQGQKPRPIEIPRSKTKTHRNSIQFSLNTPRISTFYFNWPLEFLHTDICSIFIFIHIPPPSGNCKSLPPSSFLWIFISGIAHY